MIILEEGHIPERKVCEFFIHFKGSFHEIVLIGKIASEGKTQFITSNSFSNNSLEYHKNISSLHQLFYDKGINQLDLKIGISHDPPFAFVSRTKEVSGPVTKYKALLCKTLNSTCFVNNKDFNFDLILSFQVPRDGQVMRLQSFSFSYPIEFNHYCLLVSKAKVLSSLWGMAYALEHKLLICVPIIFIMSGIFWYYIVKGTETEKSLYDIYFLLYGIMINNSTYIRLKARIERIFCLSFIVLSFFLLFGYTCKMISFLVVPEYEKDINTLSNLHGMKILYTPTYDKIVFKMSKHHFRDFQNLKINRSLYLAMKDFFVPTRIDPKEHDLTSNIYEVFLPIYPGNCQILYCDAAKMFAKSTDNLKDDLVQYHVMKEEAAVMHKSFNAKARSPVMKYVDLLNARLIESGIWKFWGTERPFQARRTADSHQKQEHQNKGTLGMSTILEFWKILFGGFFLALFAFLGEILYFFIIKFLNKKKENLSAVPIVQ